MVRSYRENHSAGGRNFGDFPEKCSNLIRGPVPRDQARRSTYSRRLPGQVVLSRGPTLEVTLTVDPPESSFFGGPGPNWRRGRCWRGPGGGSWCRGVACNFFSPPLSSLQPMYLFPLNLPVPATAFGSEWFGTIATRGGASSPPFACPSRLIFSLV